MARKSIESSGESRRKCRIGRWGIFASALLAADLVAAEGFAEEIRNWPCEQPLAERFVPEEVWGGELPAPLKRGWQDDPAVRAVVDYAANPENTPGLGSKRIAAVAEQLGDRREGPLLLVFAGLLERFDLQREFVIGGIRDFVLRAKIIDEAVARNQAALDALPEDGGEAVERERAGYREARFWDERHLDDAMEEAEFLCHRYAYLEKKLRALTAAIRSAL